MKKMMIAVMALLVSVCQIQALETGDSYQAASTYYQNVTTVSGLDEMVTLASLGVDCSEMEIDALLSTDYASNIAQSILALVAKGENPNNYNDVDYVTLLEDAVQENGAVTLTGDTSYGSWQYICVNALYVINSEKLSIAADYLASLQNENGSFSSAYGEDVDVTGWVLETLALVDASKYSENITNVVAYLETVQEDSYYIPLGYEYDGVYYPGSANANTQATVLLGLIAAKQDYEDAYQALLTFQNEDGSFWYYEAGEDNNWATKQAVLTIGTYENGSVYEALELSYQAILELVPEVEESMDSNIVQTSDISMITFYLTTALLALFVMSYEKKSI
ncbi:prenyltransferase/squalene oxidase repeat-containing protein [Tannockella kyphosi]|uniref:prenyltransferase/squalene oxidase repeat-containing protein n=1 Tax=Tannockella kyphosi TaxID=2899121 RepID=UPI002012A297|nr:prenyltransferase/squalene oxidase repeat-containing protein [Tannockella kyphosi]